MRVLLLSTYELGRQPVHLASPSASLSEAGHEVRAVDTSVSPLDAADLAWADRVAISVPMHTATRLADGLVAAIKAESPAMPVALYGLYAGVGDGADVARFEGEYEPALIRWVAKGEPTSERHLGRSEFSTPDRAGLADLSEYARLEWNGTTKLAGAVEASHGCRHRCRHCPIPAVYDGRIRVVPKVEVLTDIDNLVAAGAGHVTFGDADFLNAPAHSLAVLEEAHERHPGVTFDATIKVEHLLDHRDLLGRLSAANVLFVVSAFESVDEETLEILDKGHTVSGMSESVRLVNEAGMHIRPTWLPFMPWTKPADVAGILDFINAHGLAAATDPVQLAIKLLVPRGSLLERHPAMLDHLGDYDAEALTWRWRFADPASEVLQKELESIAAGASDCGQEVSTTLAEMREAIGRSVGRELLPISSEGPVPRLTESWFCCAEPTDGQAVTITLGR